MMTNGVDQYDPTPQYTTPGEEFKSLEKPGFVDTQGGNYLPLELRSISQMS